MHNGDLLPLLPVREIGKPWGWRVERPENLDRVETAVRRGQAIAVYQDAGRTDWWQPHGGWPHHCERLTAWPTASRWEALLVISDRIHPALPPGLEARTVIYRPQTLTVGVACRRGLELDALDHALGTLFQQQGLSRTSLLALAASARRKHEPALVAFTDEHELPFLTYAREKLLIARAASGGKPGRLRITDSCEAAALLAAGGRQLLVPKTLVPPVVLAVARRAPPPLRNVRTEGE